MLYQQKYPVSNNDIPLHIGKALEYGRKMLNTVLGREHIPNENPKVTSFMKVLDSANHYFQIKTLGLNLLSGFASAFGSMIQVNTQAGVYYKAREVGSNSF